MSDLLTTILELPPIYARVGAMPPQVSYLTGCGSFKQFCNTLRGLIDPVGYCPFCAQEHARRNRAVLAERAGWMLIQNEFKHRNTAKMALIVPVRHLTEIAEISGDEAAAVFDLLNIWHRMENVPGGGMLMRFGDPFFHTGTVDHLHINLVEPTPGTMYRPPLAKNQEELANDYERMILFRDQLILKGGADWLFSSEGVAETLP